MTNEQLTQEVISIKEHQAKCDAERENVYMIIEQLKEDIRLNKALAEDVHIMALNMTNMHDEQKEFKENTNKQFGEINKKINAISSQEFLEYKENKKIIKQNILNKLVGTIIGIIIMYIAFKLGLDKYL